MDNIKNFKDFANESVYNKVIKMIIENSMDFVDTAEVSDSDISDFRQRQEEILQKYPSLSDMDRENITSRMNGIITSGSVSGVELPSNNSAEL